MGDGIGHCSLRLSRNKDYVHGQVVLTSFSPEARELCSSLPFIFYANNFTIESFLGF